MVALSQETKAGEPVPFAEFSTDGGASWQEPPFCWAGPGTAVTALASGSGGFTAATQSGRSGQQDAQIWTSATAPSRASTQVSGLGGGGTDEGRRAGLIRLGRKRHRLDRHSSRASSPSS